MAPNRELPAEGSGGAAVAPLAAFGSGDIARAGGKGANLGELVRAGFPVPAGFVITTDAYTQAIEQAGIASRLDAHDADDGSALRDQIASLTMPQGLAADIEAALERLGGNPVAVRSSATAEDLPRAAFAGQQDTYLNVSGIDGVLRAVRRCWASLWNDRAIAYRRRLGIEPTELSIAVVVQTMVAADVAGVLFTANPVSGKRDQIVIDAGAGLGEAVVSGRVTPDHYLLEASGKLVDWSAGLREVVIRAADGQGVTEEAGEASGEPLLTGDMLAELARLGTAVAEHFGGPQDTEWAYAAGRMHLLQARPMTALPPPPLKLNRIQRVTGSVFTDYFTTRPYPLDMTTWLPYGPLGMMQQVLGGFGLRFDIDDILPEVDGVVYQFIPPSPKPSFRVLATPFRVIARSRRFDPASWMSDKRFAEFRRGVDELAASDAQRMPWAALVRLPRTALNAVDPITALRSDYLPGVGISMVRLVASLRLLGKRALFGDLIIGAHTLTVQSNEALGEVARVVRDDPALRQAFAEHDVERLVAGLHSDPDFAEFARAFDAYLGRYGFRETASPVLVSPPTWGESPQTVLGLIASLATEREHPETESRAAAAEAELFSHRAMRNPKRRARMERRLAAARAGMGFREDSHFCFMEPLPVLRRALLEIGERLSAAGVLAAAGGVFHLRLEEIESIDDDRSMSTDAARSLAKTVASRAARREELSGVPMIDLAALFAPATGMGDAIVSGTPACAGVVTGVVRVIRTTEEFGKLQAGEILVCPYTNPSWTPLFQHAAAVVVDTGGAGSHAAIVAREYGIPAIMGTGVATSVLQDGRRVVVDGNRGVVTDP